MARNSLTFGLADADELASLPSWFQLAGVESEAPSGNVQKFVDARAAGYLSAATGSTWGENLSKLMAVPLRSWFFARTRVMALRLNGRAIGMSVAGASQPALDYLSNDTVRAWISSGRPSDPENWPRDVRKFLAVVTMVEKINLVAVHPDQQGRGHGARLIKRAVATAEAGGTAMLYGQFRGPRSPSLAQFYTRQGFTVLAEGEPLAAAMVTGEPDDCMLPGPGERFFVKYLQ